MFNRAFLVYIGYMNAQKSNQMYKITRKMNLEDGSEFTRISWEKASLNGPVLELAQAPMSKATVLWEDRPMKAKTGFIVWVTPLEKKFFDTYEEAWRFAEAEFQKTGRYALVEAVN